jgi:hypothetical protein
VILQLKGNEPNTLIIKSNRQSRSGAEIGPEPNIFKAASYGQSDRIIRSIEDKSISTTAPKMPPQGRRRVIWARG